MGKIQAFCIILKNIDNNLFLKIGNKVKILLYE